MIAHLTIGVNDTYIRKLAGKVPIAAHLAVIALEVPQRLLLSRHILLC